MIIVNKTHHELLIAYNKYRLSKLPYGFFEMHRGKPVVCITRDPNNPGITSKNKRRLRVDSEQGRFFSRLIEEARLIKSKLDHLINLWKNTYWKEPRDIKFPLKKTDYGKLTGQLYFQSEESCNPILTKSSLIDYNGHTLRSKNELIACKSFDSWGYEYKTEIDLSPDRFTNLYPDVTFYAPEIEKPVAVEIDGAADNESYLMKAENRKFMYLSNGYREYKDVIFLRIINPQDYNDRLFKDLISAAILCNLSDIII